MSRFHLTCLFLSLGWLLIMASASTLEVCSDGCAYRTVTSALMAAQDKDEVHLHSGHYTNEDVAGVVDKQITIRADDGAVVYQDKGIIAMWTFHRSLVILQGHLTLMLNPSFSGVFGSFFFYSKVVQEGDLSIIIQGNGVGVSLVKGYWEQKGRLSLEVKEQCNPKGDIRMGGLYINGSWVVEESASIDVHLDDQSSGITVDTSSIVQYGSINVKSNGGQAITVLGSSDIRIWEQHGRIDITMRNRGTCIFIKNGNWHGYGPVNIDTDDHTTALACSASSSLDFSGPVKVREGDACFSLSDPHTCQVNKPVACS